MPQVDINAANSWLTLIVESGGVVTLTVAFVRRLIRREMQSWRKELEPIRRQTEQLEHNGGNHVADYARDARDTGEKAERASKRAEKAAKLAVREVGKVAELARQTAQQLNDVAELVDDSATAARAARTTAQETERRVEDFLAGHDRTKGKNR